MIMIIRALSPNKKRQKRKSTKKKEKKKGQKKAQKKKKIKKGDNVTIFFHTCASK